MDFQKEKLIAEIENFKTEILKIQVVKVWAESHSNSDPFKYSILENENYKVWWPISHTKQLWETWLAAKADAANQPDQMTISFDRFEELMSKAVNAVSKTVSVSEEKIRSDFEIIHQTIELVDLLATSTNVFQRDPKNTVYPFESHNPRVREWWRTACQIQDLLTQTDPENCDFEEYKAMIEAQEQGQ